MSLLGMIERPRLTLKSRMPPPPPPPQEVIHIVKRPLFTYANVMGILVLAIFLMVLWEAYREHQSNPPNPLETQKLGGLIELLRQPQNEELFASNEFHVDGFSNFRE